ncbi:MAG: hypothetical protein JNL21_38535 [Myxococcales bacterium]|nr:hypothetical protein [Myxococcales bacterium]
MLAKIFASLLLLGLVGIGACGGGTTVVDVTEYDQTCEADTDCVVVRDGDICCGCPNAAINKGDLQAYEDDLGECDAVCDIGCVGTMVAFCDQGTCNARQVETACAPGEEVSCSCAGGVQGTKACLADGSDFGECVCMGG